MTKFGYVKREATNQVDWSAVAQQFTTVLQEEANVRNQQKAEIDKASREMVDTLNNAPSGEYVDGNTFISNYASDASQVLLTQDRLLKQGVLKPRDYAVVRANLNDSNKQMFKLAQSYQEAYKLKMERMNSADPATRSQMLEQWKMEQAEGLYNLRNTKALINPNSGMVSIGLWKDGKMDTNPGAYQTIPELMGNLSGEYDYFDVRKEVNTAVDDLGIIDEIDVKYAGEGGLDMIFKTSSQGGRYSGDDEVLKEYFEWAGYTADAMMSNPFHVTSILTNENLRASNGKQYTFSYEPDESKREPNEIYLDRTNNRSGEPVFTDEQKGKVKNAIIERLNDSVDKKIDVKSSRRGYEPTATKNDRKNKGVAENSFNKLSDLYYGDAASVKAAETYFRDNFTDVAEVQKKGNIIYVTNTSGVTKEVPLVDDKGNLMSFTDFAESAVLLTGEANIAESVDLAGGVRSGVVEELKAGETEGTYDVIFKDGRVETKTGDILQSPYKVGKTFEYGSITETSSGAGTKEDETPLQQSQRYYEGEISADIFTDQSEGDAEELLEPLISMFGFTVDQASVGYNELKISKGKESITLGTNENANGGRVNAQKLISFLNANTTAEQADSLQDFLNKKVGKNTAKGGGSMADY